MADEAVQVEYPQTHEHDTSWVLASNRVIHVPLITPNLRCIDRKEPHARAPMGPRYIARINISCFKKSVVHMSHETAQMYHKFKVFRGVVEKGGLIGV